MDTRIKAVIFDEEKHTYTYNGKSLCGVTGAICKMFGKSFPDNDTVKLATMYGNDVHHDVENYYNKSKELSTEGGKWIVETLSEFIQKNNIEAENIECEVMVSDFDSTASKVDVVLTTKDNSAYLFDIKTTSAFDRTYCSLQLSVYKRLYRACYEREVKGMFVLGTKSRRLFRILDQDETKIAKVFMINKEALS